MRILDYRDCIGVILPCFLVMCETELLFSLFAAAARANSVIMSLTEFFSPIVIFSNGLVEFDHDIVISCLHY